MKAQIAGRRRRTPIVALGLAIVVVALLATGCPPPPPSTTVTFTIQRLLAKVFWGSAGSSMSELTASTPQSFPVGYAADTDNSGEAQLKGTLASNATCTIYVFRLSSLAMKACEKAQWVAPNPPTCQQEGNAVYKSCKGHLTFTSSGKIQFTGSWVSLTYVPEPQVTLVIVLEGEAQLEPVTNADTYALGPPISIRAERVVYTAPDAMLDKLGPIAGLPPRQPLPLTDLPALIQGLQQLDPRVVPWMEDTAQLAQQDGLPFPGAPGSVPPPPGPGLSMRGGGGFLNDERVQSAVLSGMDWAMIDDQVFGQSVPVSVQWLQGPAVDARSVPYDPERAKAMLADANQTGGLITILFPGEDPQLQKTAERIARSLGQIGIRAELAPAPGGELEKALAARLEAGEAALGLTRQ